MSELTPTIPALADAVIRSMDDNPGDWHVDNGGFRLCHELSNIDVWVANGFWFYSIKGPRHIRFGAWGKIRFALAYRRWRKTQLRADTGSDLLAVLSPETATAAADDFARAG